MRFEGLLGRNVSCFWGTTYSFGLKLFDQYLLRRLSHGPLNAVVLVDRDKLAEVWESLPDGDHYLAGQAGRRYLLRGLKPPGGGAFHPKTYLFARSDRATLVVGSGNLTPGGIDHGREVFTSFSSDHDEDLPSMRAWGAWMSRLVAQQGDERLKERWAALREQCQWMLGAPDGSSCFYVNDERPMLEQVRDRLPDAVSELHLTAPFFDRDAEALGMLIEACDPERVVMYLGDPIKVHGPSLRAVLDAADQVTLKRFEPRGFVHAKAIGAIGDDSRGVLLMGSPNLSRAALTLTCAEGAAGNCETAVLREGSAEQIAEVFEGSGMQLSELSPEALLGFEFGEEDEAEAISRPVVLKSASWRGDGRIIIDASGLSVGTDAALAWTETGQDATLDAEGVTVEPLEESDPCPVIVWLVDAEGRAVSNRVSVEDPAALDETLVGTEGKRESRPREVEGLEASPLVRMVLWANDRFIFDLDANSAIQRAKEAAGEEAGAEEVSDFWERYAKEELEYDPRSQIYRPLTPGLGSAPPPVEELLRELQTLLHAAPGTLLPVLRLLKPVSPEEGKEEPASGTPWSMEARQRVRAYNLLTRWCSAVADPRHRLLAPNAPVVNYQTLLGVILAAWLHEALEPIQLRRLLFSLLSAFVGAGEGKGFLGQVKGEEREAALVQLDLFAMEAAAGLACVAMESSWKHDIYHWQPVLERGLRLDVLLLGEASIQVFERLSGKLVGVNDLAALLDKRIRWVDDDNWCRRLAEELELESLSLDLHRQAKVRAAVTVHGAGDPLRDQRLLTVARRALEFKSLPAIAVLCGGDVLVFEPGQGARARVGGKSVKASTPLTVVTLLEVERQGGAWADLLGSPAEAAA